MMTDFPSRQGDKLAEIFARINMSELPAMSVHVQKLLSLSSADPQTNYNKLSEIILRDFSLTNKVLQVANSAYFSIRNRVNTVSSAVAVLGFGTVRELALGIALFDDFIQAGVEKEEIGQLLARSFLSALLSRNIAESRDLQVEPEEAFICALLHNLGRIIACIYLPGEYKEIARLIEQGKDKDTAAAEVLSGVNFSDLGQEVARFWSMTETVIDAMSIKPEKIKEFPDPRKNLLMLVDFSNRFVDALCDLNEIETLMEQYGYHLAVDEEEAVEVLEKSIDASGVIFSAISSGLATLDLRNKLEKILKLPAGEKEARTEEKAPGNMAGSPATPWELKDYIQELSAMLLGEFALDVFFATMLDALYKGIGFSRVVIAMPVNRNGGKKVVGRLARGDIASPECFSFVIQNLKDIPSRCYSECKMMAVSGNEANAFPGNLRSLVGDRMIYLFPVCLRGKTIAIIYMDRSLEEEKLIKKQVNSIKLLCNLVIEAVKKSQKK